MKNLLVTLAAVFAMSSVMAEDTSWKITEVPGKDKAIVGYIYHVGAVGTQVGAKTEKVVTSLRFVCSTKISTQRDNDPLIVLYWNTMTGVSTQHVLSRTSADPLDRIFQWEQDGPLLIRSVNESKDIIQKMRLSKNISFTWLGNDAVRRTTIFDLRTFDSHLGEFNALCKTEL